MVAFAADYAPTTEAPDAKNRARGIFLAVEVRAGENDLESRFPRREKAGLSYETASGPTNFLNRDPIGEVGGLNLYAFVGNDPVNALDYLGLWNLIFSLTDINTPGRGRHETDTSFYWNNARRQNVIRAQDKAITIANRLHRFAEFYLEDLFDMYCRTTGAYDLMQVIGYIHHTQELAIEVMESSTRDLVVLPGRDRSAEAWVFPDLHPDHMWILSNRLSGHWSPTLGRTFLHETTTLIGRTPLRNEDFERDFLPDKRMQPMDYAKNADFQTALASRVTSNDLIGISYDFLVRDMERGPGESINHQHRRSAGSKLIRRDGKDLGSPVDSRFLGRF